MKTMETFKNGPWNCGPLNIEGTQLKKHLEILLNRKVFSISFENYPEMIVKNTHHFPFEISIAFDEDWFSGTELRYEKVSQLSSEEQGLWFIINRGLIDMGFGKEAEDIGGPF